MGPYEKETYFIFFRKNIEAHLYRGYTLISKEGEIKTSVRNFQGVKPPLVFAFGSFEDSWQSLAQSLFAFPVFAAAIQRYIFTCVNHYNCCNSLLEFTMFWRVQEQELT